MTAMFYIVLSFFFLLSLLLCFVILIQEAKSLGLGASFGGEGGDSLFGTSTAFILKRFTAYLSGAFLVGCLLLSLMSASLGRKDVASLSTPAQQEVPQGE